MNSDEGGRGGLAFHAGSRAPVILAEEFLRGVPVVERAVLATTALKPEEISLVLDLRLGGCVKGGGVFIHDVFPTD